MISAVLCFLSRRVHSGNGVERTGSNPAGYECGKVHRSKWGLTTHFFASFFRVSSGSFFAMLIFVGQRPSFSPSFFASSLSTFVSIFLINSPSSFCSIDNRRGIGKIRFTILMSMAACYSQNAAAFTRPSPHLRVELMLQGTLPEPVPERRDTPAPLRLPGGKGIPPHPSALPPPPSNSFTPLFFPTPDQFLETSRRRQTPTPHSRTRVAPPTPSDRDPIRDRVRGREYPHPLPPLRAHEGVPPLRFVFRAPTETPGSAAFVSCANRGTPPPHMP